MDYLTLAFDRPAEAWNEALPLGNGSMGAMSYGRLREEKIELNLDTLWSGTGRSKENKNTDVDWDFLRQKIFDGEYEEAEAYCKENILGDWTESYLPAGNLHIDANIPELKEHGSYQRQLSIKDALEQVVYRQDGQGYLREFFVSMSEPVMALHYRADAGSSLELRISLDSQIRHVCSGYGTSELVLEGQAPVYAAPSYYSCEQPIVYEEGKGTRFAIGISVQAPKGCVCQKDNTLLVTADGDVYIYLSGITDFQAQDSYLSRKKQMLEQICDLSYPQLKEAHKKAYAAYFDRMDLTLDPGIQNDLITKMFHYARYLMISSSKPGTQCANLQGIWNHNLRAPWSSNYTVNINTEMNYWLNGPCNLIESFEPFVDFVEELSHAGEETAKKQCHCSGWTANHNVDIWRQTGPVDGEPKYAYWPMGGVWLCSQSYEYFRYSEDLKTLKNKIYPSLRGSVLFCLDWMQQREDGLYYTAPSTSPENTFEDDEGHSCGVSYMTTMDLAIIKELFANYLAAADVLGIEEDLIKLVKERSKLLPGYQIGKTGMIQEWIKDFEKSDVGHRHFSPVFGFHPGHSIKKTDTELVQACQNFIEEKAENFKQQIGWSCAWLINLWARLGDGTKANHYYEELLRQSVYDNLFDLHPPLGETEGEREVFQIDGNFGSASGVAEMLISSEKGKITILPALPDSWKNGKVRGLLAAGAIEVDITWKDRKPVSVSLCSSSDQNVSLFYRNRKLAEQIELKKQEQQIINLCSCE
mgnify:CR=1 FL=1